MSILQVVLSGKCVVVHTHLPWTTCYSNQQSPNELRFRDGSSDLWDVDHNIQAGWKMHHVCSLPKNVESQVV